MTGVPQIVVAEAGDRQLRTLVREAGLPVGGTWSFTDLALPQPRQTAPDLLLLDVRGGEGLPREFATFRRRFPHTKVILVTGSVDVPLLREGMRAGVNECLCEPLKPAELRAAVDHVLGQATPPDARGRTLMFAGAKGGVGTSTVAVNVAAALCSHAGASVALVDAHVRETGDAALLLGVEPKFSIIDALENVHRLDGSLMSGLVSRAKAGPDLLAAPARLAARTFDVAGFRLLVNWLSERYHDVVVDLPPIDPAALDVLDPASVVVLVVNQEVPTIRRAVQVAELLRERCGRDRVVAVVNRYEPGADIVADDIARAIRLPIWATLPNDYRRVMAAANTGRPVVTHNHSRLATAIHQLAARLGHAPGTSETRERAPAARLAVEAGVE
jgi:pilus assembly protein CpaE